jgi:CRISPR/Cas system-associated exonuclease Cas4 (RecB family)
MQYWLFFVMMLMFIRIFIANMMMFMFIHVAITQFIFCKQTARARQKEQTKANGRDHLFVIAHVVAPD